MAKIIGTPILIISGDGSSADKFSTLPPPVTNLTAEAGNATVTVSFDSVPADYEQYLSDEAAYIVVLKQGSVPTSPTDGIVVKLSKEGEVITEGETGGNNSPMFTPSPASWFMVHLDGALYALTEEGQLASEIVIPSEINGVAITTINPGVVTNNQTSVIMVNNITNISDWAFSSCTGLISVTIGTNVTNIGMGAFNGCTSLTTVNYIGTEEQWNAITIGAMNEPLTNATKVFNYRP